MALLQIRSAIPKKESANRTNCQLNVTFDRNNKKITNKILINSKKQNHHNRLCQNASCFFTQFSFVHSTNHYFNLVSEYFEKSSKSSFTNREMALHLGCVYYQFQVLTPTKNLDFHLLQKQITILCVFQSFCWFFFFFEKECKR